MSAFGSAHATQAALFLQLFDVPFYGSLCNTDQ
jgi:hypothetical protein